MPYTLNPIPYTLYPIPYTHIPYTLYPIPYTLYPIPYTLNRLSPCFNPLYLHHRTASDDESKFQLSLNLLP